MSQDLSCQLDQLTSQVKSLKQIISETKREQYLKQISEIDNQINILDIQLTPLINQKTELLKSKKILKEEMIESCEHEFVDYRNFDGHRTYSMYTCQLCNFSHYNPSNFKVIKREYIY